MLCSEWGQGWGGRESNSDCHKLSFKVTDLIASAFSETFHGSLQPVDPSPRCPLLVAQAPAFDSHRLGSLLPTALPSSLSPAVVINRSSTAFLALAPTAHLLVPLHSWLCQNSSHSSRSHWSPTSSKKPSHNHQTGGTFSLPQS